MIDYKTHKYSLWYCDVVMLKNHKEYILWFDTNNCCKLDAPIIRKCLRTDKM